MDHDIDKDLLREFHAQAASIMPHAINELSRRCHAASYNAGWWHDPMSGVGYKPGDNPEGASQILIDVKAAFFPYVVGTKLMLMVSEVAEAMEGHRKGLSDDKLPHRSMIEVELADALIRICDLAGALGLDLGGAVVEKMGFNLSRPDHQVATGASRAANCIKGRVMAEVDFKGLWQRAQDNRGKIDACPCHVFPANTVVQFGGKVTCERCGGTMGLVEAFRYVQGYEAAGGLANDIWPNFREPTTEPTKRRGVCPRCSGNGYIEPRPQDYFDCDMCEGSGELEFVPLPSR